MTGIENKVALITGSGNQKGRAICKKLSDEGAKVIIHYYKNKDSSLSLFNYLKNKGRDAFIFQADIRKEDEIKDMFTEANKKFGSIDILVNNVHEKILRTSFEKTTWEEHQAQLDVITKGSYYCIQESLNVMLRKKEGTIINILSSQINMPVKGYSSFATAVSSMVGFTRNLANEVGTQGIRVNMIAPGFTIADKSEHAPLHAREKIIEQTPLKRLATPEDIANAVIFLASNYSSFITGGYLVVDGGMVML